MPNDDRTVVLRELRRSRKYLRSLLEGLSEDETERAPRRGRGGCIKWHVGHVAFLERQILASLVPALATDVPERWLCFAPAAMHDRDEPLPLLPEIERSLATGRQLTEALLDNVTLDARALDVFREIVNADYAQARHVRRFRATLGRVDVSDPGGRLVVADTDCDAAPRFHVASWDLPLRAGRTGDADVVSLEDHRHGRAMEAIEGGHRLVAAGDLQAALKMFEEAAALEESADALTFQAWMHSLTGDVDRAERLCLRAIRLDPDFGNPYNDIGTFRLQRRDVTAAIQWFERAKRARRYEPRHFPFINLGKLYLSLGMPDKALAEFEGALAHAPANPDIRTTVDRLRQELQERDG
jgi:Tfp pilus assembly protein PilF